MRSWTWLLQLYGEMPEKLGLLQQRSEAAQAQGCSIVCTKAYVLIVAVGTISACVVGMKSDVGP